MRIKLTQNARVLVPAGTEIDLEDSQAAMLIGIGHAMPVKGAKEKPVVKAVKAPTEKKTKK